MIFIYSMGKEHAIHSESHTFKAVYLPSCEYSQDRKDSPSQGGGHYHLIPSWSFFFQETENNMNFNLSLYVLNT